MYIQFLGNRPASISEVPQPQSEISITNRPSQRPSRKASVSRIGTERSVPTFPNLVLPLNWQYTRKANTQTICIRYTSRVICSHLLYNNQPLWMFGTVYATLQQNDCRSSSSIAAFTLCEGQAHSKCYQNVEFCYIYYHANLDRYWFISIQTQANFKHSLCKIISVVLSLEH